MRHLLLLPLLSTALYAVDPRISFSEPAVSPDGSEIAFISGGDIWTVPARGGEARLLVSHPAAERWPRYSPDGKYLAFTSSRTGGGDVYVLTLATGLLKRLTFDDAPEQTEGWSPDSRYVYFSSSAHDVSGTTDIFRVSRDGGTPMEVTADRYTSESSAAPSPDGQTLAFTAHGFGQWWRKGHSHIDESEIWLMHEGAPAKYARVTEGHAREAWPMWSKDAKTLFYMSDRSGAQNIWQKALGGPARQVTKFTDGRVLWPAISADGRTIVFERDFRIWKTDTASGKAAPVEIVPRGAPAGTGMQHLTINGGFGDFALSPDNKKIAFTSHGEIFAASASDGGDAVRLTRTPAAEMQLTWAPDSMRIAYVSGRNGANQIYLYDFRTSQETQLTTSGPDGVPRFSPDGKLLAFIHDGRELRVLEMAGKKERVLATGYFDRAPLLGQGVFTWSPDSHWVAYLSLSAKSFSNVFVVPAAGGKSEPVTFLANTFSQSVAWSPDGKYLLFVTNQRTEPGKLARVDLVLHTPEFREDKFRDLFKDEAPAKPTPDAPPKTTAPATDAKAAPAKPEDKPAETKPADDKKPAPAEAAKPEKEPLKIVFEGIHDRLTLVPVGVDVQAVSFVPDGKQIVIVGSVLGHTDLYGYTVDELARGSRGPRQLTTTDNSKDDVYITSDSKEVFFLDGGSIKAFNRSAHETRNISVTTEMDVDFAQEKMEVFREAWTYIRDQFFDEKFNGVDWNAIRAEYEPLIGGAATTDEMRRLLNLMVGELNASHSGAGGGGGGSRVTARLGLRFDRAEYEKSGKFKVTEAIRLGPAHVAGIKPGDVLEAIDKAPLDAHSNLDELLSFRIGKRVLLTVSGKDIPVLPVGLGTEKELLYRQWVEDNRAYVSKISGGKLGYVHMEDMGEGSLERLHLDLDSENQAREGVVIDIRNNNGGFVNAMALDIFTRRPYLRMTERGKPEAPARAVLGQRALEAPTILVTNQYSLSDAEDFTEGYRTLKLGKVVGEPTAGWIIYTWGTGLIDGTSLRLPRSRIRGAAGDDLEMHPRPVDIQASRPMGESYLGRDSQLDAAVKELLAELSR
jgi:Tol biopolymer transport system component/C-terminal processing protease CtpA/Prc